MKEDVWARRFAPVVMAAALLVIPVMVIEQTASPGGWRTVAGVLNWAIWVVFLAEAVTLLALTPDRWRWVREHPLEVAVVILTPPFLPAGLQAARAFRLLRLVRLLRILQIGRRLFTIEGVKWAGVLALMTALGGGAAFAAVEGREVSAWDGIYWAVTTMTTVGYGDVSPHTDSGRVIAMCVMLVGIGFVSVVVAALAERFVRQDVVAVEAAVETDVHAELESVRLSLARLEAAIQNPRS